MHDNLASSCMTEDVHTCPAILILLYFPERPVHMCANGSIRKGPKHTVCNRKRLNTSWKSIEGHMDESITLHSNNGPGHGNENEQPTTPPCRGFAPHTRRSERRKPDPQEHAVILFTRKRSKLNSLVGGE